MRLLFIFLWKMWFFLINIVILSIIVPLGAFFLYINRYNIFFAVIRTWAWFSFHLSGFRLKMEGVESLDLHKQYIFVANHTSMLDVLIMLIMQKNHPFVFVGKEEVARYPIMGRLYKKTNILVDRSSRESRLKVYAEAKKKLDQGLSICIFPEGGIPKEEVVLGAFRDGAFGIAIEHQVPIVPYTFAGGREHFPYDLFRGSPGVIRLKQHPIIDTTNLTKKDISSLKENTRQIILEQLEVYYKLR